MGTRRRFGDELAAAEVLQHATADHSEKVVVITDALTLRECAAVDYLRKYHGYVQRTRSQT